MALADENSYAIDPNELQADQQINNETNPAARPDNILGPWLQPDTSTNEIPSIF